MIRKGLIVGFSPLFLFLPESGPRVSKAFRKRARLRSRPRMAWFGTVAWHCVGPQSLQRMRQKIRNLSSMTDARLRRHLSMLTAPLNLASRAQMHTRKCGAWFRCPARGINAGSSSGLPAKKSRPCRPSPPHIYSWTNERNDLLQIIAIHCPLDYAVRKVVIRVLQNPATIHQSNFVTSKIGPPREIRFRSKCSMASE